MKETKTIVIKTKEKGVKKMKKRKETRSKEDGNIFYDTQNILRRREAVEKKGWKRVERKGKVRKRKGRGCKGRVRKDRQQERERGKRKEDKDELKGNGAGREGKKEGWGLGK
jgi:hypothetical protein